jgi:FkbM family methyltransferase
MVNLGRTKRKLKNGATAALILARDFGHRALRLSLEKNKRLPTGSTLCLDTSQKTQMIQYLRAVYEPHILELARIVLRPGDTVLDIGSHVGYWTLSFSDLVGPTGCVWAFEPEPRNFKRLMQNLEMNAKQNVCARNVALSDDARRAHFVISASNEGGHWLVPKTLSTAATAHQFGEVIELQTETVDRIWQNESSAAQRSSPVRLVKIDVEGHELEALGGMHDLISSAARPQHFIIEVSRRESARRKAVYELMTTSGYECRHALHPQELGKIGPLEGLDDMYFVFV